MPNLLAFALPSVFGVGGSLALVTASGLTIGGQLVSIAGSLLLSSALAKRPTIPTPEDVQLNVRQSTGARIRHYGRVRAGGTIVFFRARGGKFYRVVVHGHGQIDGIEGYYLNRGPVAADGSGWVTDAQYVSGGTQRVRILTRTGQVPETHYGEITAIWPDWDSSHRGDGLWSSLTIAEQVPPEDFRRVYPNNEPGIEIVARTSKIFDPRSGVTAYSENAALVIADFIEHPDGMNRAGAVDRDMLIAAADIADAQVPLAAGGTEARWRLCGSYALNEEPGQVLRRMLDACGGELRLLPNGKIGIEMGGWVPPTVTLTAADILEIGSGDDGPDQLDRFNTLPFTYTDPALGFQTVEGDPWHDAVRAAADTEEMTGGLADLGFAPSHRQARHAAKIAMGRKNPARRLTIRCKPRAIVALYETNITLAVGEPFIDGDWRIEAYDLNLLTGAVTYSLASAHAGDGAWSVAEEGRAQILPDPDVPQGIPVPANFAAAPQGVQIADGTWSAGIVAAWDPAASDALTPVLEYKKAADANWIVASVPRGAATAGIAGLVNGVAYDVRVKFAASDGTPGAYATAAGITALASTTPPAAPSGLAVADLGGGVARVSLTTSASADLRKTEIRRGASLIATLYAGPAQAVSFDDASGAGTFSWTARSINVAGTASASDAGPVARTIT